MRALKLCCKTPTIKQTFMEVRMTHEELLNKLEEIRQQKNIPIDEFYPSIGICKSTFHLWKRGAVPKSIEVCVNIYNELSK